MEILDAITITPDVEEIQRRLHVTKDGERHRVCGLIERVWEMIEPRAVYRACPITSRRGSGVTLDRVLLKSRVLRKQLEHCEQAFPYVVTLGSRLEENIRASRDILEQYYLDTIGNFVLSRLLDKMEAHVRARYGFPCVSSMAPGSLEDWPLEEQGPLFSLVGDVKAAIGVALTEVFLMIPTKSESGILFPTSEKFYSCQLCPRKDCMNRKTAYDETASTER